MIFEKVKELIVKELSVDAEKVTMEAHLVDDLGADSLDAMELIMAVEDAFDISVDDEAAQTIKKVGDLVAYIESQK